MKANTEFRSHFINNFPFEPTKDQQIAIEHLSNYIFNQKRDQVFLLKGYAGTGKTTLVSALIKALAKTGKKSVLLAPTGRAAKVLAGYTGMRASTVHRKIYFFSGDKQGNMKITLTPNLHKNTIFIVDEASMIPDARGNQYDSIFNRDLLSDLLEYVYFTDSCKVIFIGDTAQLPPVNLNISPALNPEYFKDYLDYEALSFEMHQVLRQAQGSGILSNATSLRQKLSAADIGYPFFSIGDFKDIRKVTGADLEEHLQDYFNNRNEMDAVVITRSNKRANLFNQEIRRRILYQEGEISEGDRLMVVKNNYYWLDGETSKAGFIANGDIIELLVILGYEELYGYRYANVRVQLVDYPEEPALDVKIMLNTVMLETPSLPYPQQRELFNAIMEDCSDSTSRKVRVDYVKASPHYNALQIKFSYALTCHKTQGGQWGTVFVDQGYLTDDMINEEYLRWLYTAITRATDRVFLINFKDEFFAD
ncbi:MAG: AAA family ATPase [Bacteroidales bacterium]|nr:AAA family ATPase [Bacteroidales bacterium]